MRRCCTESPCSSRTRRQSTLRQGTKKLTSMCLKDLRRNVHVGLLKNSAGRSTKVTQVRTTFHGVGLLSGDTLRHAALLVAWGLVVGLCLSAAGADSPRPSVSRQVLWKSGKDGYHTYRIPSLVVTK